MTPCPCCGRSLAFESVRSRIIGHIFLNPGCTAKEILAAIPTSTTDSIQKLIYSMNKQLDDWIIRSQRNGRGEARYYLERK